MNRDHEFNMINRAALYSDHKGMIIITNFFSFSLFLMQIII